MQAQACVASTDGSEDSTNFQIISEDANWLANITLDSSDYNLLPTDFNFEHYPDTELLDGDAALAAHLWDRDHASDLEEYEWKSDDLVREVCFDDDASSPDEEFPRLARRDMFEQGIRRDEVWTRAYRERWEEDHIFYKQKIQARLEALGDEDGAYGEEEEYSYVSEGAWSAQAEQGWGTPATSGGGDWTAGSGEAWTAGHGGWDEWKPENREATWTRAESPGVKDADVVGEKDGFADADEIPGERCPCGRSSGPRPVAAERIAYTKPNSTVIDHFFSEPTHPPCITSALRERTDITTFGNATTFAPLSPLPSVQLSRSTRALRNPEQTPRSSDPEPLNPTEAALNLAPNNSHAPLIDSALDICILKTQTLLTTAIDALLSTATLSEAEERALDEEAEERHCLRRSEPTADAPPSVSSLSVSEEREPAPPKEIVRVEGWWKVKGGEAWSEVGGWMDECGYLR